MSVARITIFGQYVGQQTQNVLHFEQPDVTDTNVIDLCAQIDEFWINGGWLQNCSAAATWHLIRGQLLEAGHGPFDLPISRAGVLGDDHNYVPFVAAVLQIKTATGGRTGRGRTYLTGFGGGEFSSGYWRNDTLIRLEAIADAFSQYWLQGGAQHGYAHGWDLVISPRNDPTDTKIATAIVARALVGSCVRRQIGRGI